MIIHYLNMTIISIRFDSIYIDTGEIYYSFHNEQLTLFVLFLKLNQRRSLT